MSARFLGPSSGARATLLFVAVSLAGCSSDPTLVNIRVSADGTVTPVTALRLTLMQTDRQLSNLYRSLLSDTDSGAEPFRFPVTIAFNFVGASAAPTTVTVDALDYSTDYRRVAGATGSVDVKPHRAVDIELTLSAATLNPPAGDAGASDGGVDDSGADGDADDGDADAAGVSADAADPPIDAGDAEIGEMVDAADEPDAPGVIALPSSI